MATLVSKSAADVHAAFSPQLLLSAIIDSSGDAILSKALDGTVTSWNRGAERMFGYTAEEVLGQPIHMLIPPELHGQEDAVMQQLRRGELVEPFESFRLRKDGSRVPVAVTVSPIRTEDGSMLGASAVARDITMQRRSSHAANWLAAIVESSDDAIVSKDLTGTITSWNKGAQRIFGYTEDEIVGRSVLTLIPPELQHEEVSILTKLHRNERIDHYETVRVRKDGRRIDVSLTISPIRDTTGRVVGASKIARDITEQRKAMAQLAHVNEELRRADRMKSEFLAVMSHELRTPLNSIIGFASVLRQGRSGPLTDDQKRQLNLIHGSGKHLLNLINDVLDLSRIEAGRMEVEPEEFDPGEVLQNVVRAVEVQAQHKQLELRCAIEPTGPIYTDRKRFVQVALNLLSNAIKFTPQGSIEVRAYRQDDALYVSVSDTGIGIAADKQGKLFKAFSQVEGSNRRRYEGTGLGLYLSRKLVTLLGGDITLRSAPQQGSTFTFHISAHYSGTDVSGTRPPFA